MRRITPIIALLLICSYCGCSTVEKKAKKAEELKRIALKKERYFNLEQEIRANALQAGMLTFNIKDLYGEPDDIFKSSSQTGSFEIWSYDSVQDDDKDLGWETIRLYFDNNKLVSWGY